MARIIPPRPPKLLETSVLLARATTAFRLNPCESNLMSPWCVPWWGLDFLRIDEASAARLTTSDTEESRCMEASIAVGWTTRRTSLPIAASTAIPPNAIQRGLSICGGGCGVLGRLHSRRDVRSCHRRTRRRKPSWSVKGGGKRSRHGGVSVVQSTGWKVLNLWGG